MTQAKKKKFNIQWSGIPIINLRNEFNKYYALIHSDDFKKGLIGNGPIESPYFTWFRMADEFYTLIIQRPILGLETYIPSAVNSELFERQIKTKFDGDYFSMGKSWVNNLYNKLPGLIDEKYSLEKSNRKLWFKTVDFYDEVRNKIFHGKQFNGIKLEEVQNIYDYLAELYEWVDGWYDPAKIFPECGVFKDIRKKVKAYGTDIRSIQIKI